MTAEYRPHFQRTLASYKLTDGDASAALSLAVNRASKVRMLHDEGQVELARDFAENLCHAVLGYIADNPTRNAQELANIAIVTRDACYPES